MRTNITLKLDADLLKQIRVVAAEEGKSVSALLSQKLQELLLQRRNYEQAKRRALARLETGLELGWSPAVSRDELHER